MDIHLSEISDFPNHPFKVQVDAEMLEMAESVKQYGVLVRGHLDSVAYLVKVAGIHIG